MISSILTNEQIRRIHEASLTILERVGVEVPHKEILGYFADAGARVDIDAGLGMGPLGHDPRQERDAKPVQLMGDSVDRDRP